MKSARKSRKAKRAKGRKSNRTKRSGRGTLRQAIDKFVPESIFAGLPKHGNASWDFFTLVLMGFFWGWSNAPYLIDRYVAACRAIGHWLPGAFVASSYQGFVKALTTHRVMLVDLVAQQLRSMMLRIAGRYTTVEGFLAFAVDGTKVEAPWTAANEEKLGKSGRKPKGKKCQRKETDLRPQLTLTLLWHMGLQLPWAWKHGGLPDGERNQFRALLNLLPPLALIVADAGFTGYELWREIIEGQRNFLIRVGANVELLLELFPGSRIDRRDDIVYLWPKGKQTKGERPLKLRLIKLKRGKQTVYLVTSILGAKKLTEAQASILYSKRWGVECTFRAFKQTLQRRKMKSYTPEHAACELDWSLMSMWLLGLLAKQELIAADKDPAGFSTANAARLLRRELYGDTHGLDLDMALFASAVKDSYQRKSSKKARHDQRKKREKPPAAPKIIRATRQQRKAAKALEVVVALAA